MQPKYSAKPVVRTPKTEGEIRFRKRLDQRIAESGDTVKIDGQLYRVGTANSGTTTPRNDPAAPGDAIGSQGKFSETPGSRPLFGPNNTLAGHIKPDKTVELFGPGGEPGEMGKPKPIHPPKAIGYDVSWEDQRNGAGSTLQGAPAIGSQRKGKFFPFEDSDMQCVACGGKGKIPNTQESEKPILCHACQGVGRRNQRVLAFMKALTAQGFKPKVRPARGKQRVFPQAGKVSPDAQIGI